VIFVVVVIDIVVVAVVEHWTYESNNVVILEIMSSFP